nr:PilW family protein [uncultured Noviherbaspirillum sp.]
MRRRAAGLALSELLVALAIGLVLILVATALLMLVRSTYLLIDDRSRIEESGRFAVGIVSHAVRQAGYRDWSAAGASEADWLAVSGLDARSLKEAPNAIDGPYGSTVNGSDVLALRFDGNASGSGDTAMTNCAGASVQADMPGAGWSIFYIANDTAGEPELRCKYRSGNGWNAEALVRGVEAFQVLYGLDADDSGNAPRRYLAASVVAAEPDGWQRVSAVKVAMLVRGSYPGPVRSRRYDLFGAGHVDAADRGVRIEETQLPLASRGLPRQVHAATVFLRNRNGSGS